MLQPMGPATSSLPTWTTCACRYSTARQYVRTIGVTGVPYLTDGQHFFHPRGVAVAENGALYITEESGNRLVKLTASGQPVWAVGHPGVAGGWDGDNDLLDEPDGVALDRNGQVFVADKYAHGVQGFSVDGAYVRTLGEPGKSGSDNGHFRAPRGVAFGPNGYLHVANTDNQRIQIFDASFNYVATFGAASTSRHRQCPFQLSLRCRC